MEERHVTDGRDDNPILIGQSPHKLSYPAPYAAVTEARFVVQLHDATRLHYDLRLQIGDVMRSWAVPRGPSLDPAVRRLAVQVADHELSSADFEGVHLGHIRGSGAVIIWDEGYVTVVRNEPDHVSFVLQGHKVNGRFGLTRTRGRQWILVKASDGNAQRGSDITADWPASVRTGRTWQEVAARAEGEARCFE